MSDAKKMKVMLMLAGIGIGCMVAESQAAPSASITLAKA